MLGRKGLGTLAATTIGRKVRTGKKAALMGAVVSTTTAMAVGLSIPDATAATNLNAVTTGPLFRIAEALGVDSVEITTGVSILDPLTIHLGHTASDPVNLADQINAFPFGGYNILTPYTLVRQPGGALGSALLGASGTSAYQATLAYEALLSSAAGHTLPGYTPLVGPGLLRLSDGTSCSSGTGLNPCRAGTNETNLALILANSPTTPNGGLYARFAPILNLFGINPLTPGGTNVSSTTPATQGSGGTVTLNSATVGLALGYSALSDFPATLNPFSIANSLLASFLPTNLVGGGQIEGTPLNDIYTKLALLASLGQSSTSYSTYVPNDLPLLEPLRLPVRLINAATSALGFPLNLGTPLADALQPALSILVNTGYTDVKTPSAGGTYNRTYDQSGVYTPFLSKAPLTPAQWLAVPRDVITALVYGFQTEFPLLRFGQGVPALSAANGRLVITYAPAATSAAAPQATHATAAVTSVPATAAVSAASSPMPTVRALTVKTTSNGGVRSGTTTKTVPAAAAATEGNTAQATSAGTGGSTSAPTSVGRSQRAKAGTPANKAA